MTKLSPPPIVKHSDQKSLSQLSACLFGRAVLKMTAIRRAVSPKKTDNFWYFYFKNRKI